MSTGAGNDIVISRDLPHVVHGTSISIDGRGVLMLGPSGSGKSSIAFQLLALGAELVSDDLTHIDAKEGFLEVSCPKAASLGQIEARNIGILKASYTRTASLALAIDLGSLETERMPKERHAKFDDFSVPLIRKVENPAFYGMIWQYVVAM